MKRLGILLAVLLSGSCGVVQSAIADDYSSVDQTGSYTYTTVRQDGDRTKVKVHRIDPNKYDRLRDRVSAKADRINEQYLDRTRHYGAWYGYGGYGNNNVSLDQSGQGNSAYATQHGSNDSIAINQRGDSNTSYTVQQGDNLHAVTNQSGDHNITFILQRNSSAYKPARQSANPAPQSSNQPGLSPWARAIRPLKQDKFWRRVGRLSGS